MTREVEYKFNFEINFPDFYHDAATAVCFADQIAYWAKFEQQMRLMQCTILTICMIIA